MKTPQDTQNPSPVLNKLQDDVEIEGSLYFKSAFEMEGRLKGKVIADGTLIVGQKGKIEGEINAGSLIILGSVKGNAKVNAKCDIKACGSMLGDVTSGKLSMEEGAEFCGNAKTERQS